MAKQSKSGQRAGKEPAKQASVTSPNQRAKDMRAKHAKRHADKKAAKRAHRQAKRNPEHSTLKE